MLAHWIWLATLKGLRSTEKRKLLQLFSDPEEIFRLGNEAFLAAGILRKMPAEPSLEQAEKILEACQACRAGVLTCVDGAYPAQLKELSDGPLVLYYKGLLPQWQAAPVIGVVGTRNCSRLGAERAYTISAQIAACGGLVVSGGAKGIDRWATEGALAAGKPAVAVLGCGVDGIYPKENTALFHRLYEEGCVISEYIPGTPGMPGQFPRRNRLISGLSDGVLVVEAPEKSGALITAEYAAKQGRDVFTLALPTQEAMGNLYLVKENASLVHSGFELLERYKARYPGKIHTLPDGKIPDAEDFRAAFQAPPSEEKPAQSGKKPVNNDKKAVDNREKSNYSVIVESAPLPEDLTEVERQVLVLLEKGPQHLDIIMDSLELPAYEALPLMTGLCLRGLAKSLPGRMYARA